MKVIIFGALFNFVHDPAMLIVAFDRALIHRLSQQSLDYVIMRLNQILRLVQSHGYKVDLRRHRGGK
ncbi:hypothetical protein ACLMAJ_33455 [Nocardia sp. KC 131]|uniref:hypothetical protein n=1 Tax=Nocardia arseniciresistens TaxID=3392119 RepID=UPI00398F6435